MPRIADRTSRIAARRQPCLLLRNLKLSISNPAVEAVRSSDQLATLVEAAVDVAHEVGLIKRLSDDDSRKRRNSDVASIQAISLFPSPFPRSAYQQAMDVHTNANNGMSTTKKRITTQKLYQSEKTMPKKARQQQQQAEAFP
ncbi:hypothetical protein niasHS_000095 [Heterodera schachtii]|uniref:Uncharacterized protein n=1 Tax=Heterodera schachtii TaxID=97005 RepID=A0ABD2KLY0_HETSC